jgi:hypothetical protein
VGCSPFFWLLACGQLLPLSGYHPNEYPWVVGILSCVPCSLCSPTSYSLCLGFRSPSLLSWLQLLQCCTWLFLQQPSLFKRWTTRHRLCWHVWSHLMPSKNRPMDLAAPWEGVINLHSCTLRRRYRVTQICHEADEQNDLKVVPSPQ